MDLSQGILSTARLSYFGHRGTGYDAVANLYNGVPRKGPENGLKAWMGVGDAGAPKAPAIVQYLLRPPVFCALLQDGRFAALRVA